VKFVLKIKVIMLNDNIKFIILKAFAR